MNVTVVMTCCDRLDLMERTLRSFLKFNTYPIEEYIFRDDSGLSYRWDETKNLLEELKIPYIFLPEGQVGQVESIDRLMDQVKTEYVFHTEDDWEYDRKGFIEDCFYVWNDDVIQVRVRHRDDGSAAEIGEDVGIANEVLTHRFSFNPHLRSIKGFVPYGQVPDIGVTKEDSLGKYYADMKTLWLKEGACRHIGGEKTTNRPGTPYQLGVKKA